jgi:hypothetical protein
MIARDALDYSIGTSVDIFNISLDKVKSIILFEEKSDNGKIQRLKIYFDKEIRQDMLEISFTDIDEETRILLNDIPALLNLTPSFKG